MAVSRDPSGKSLASMGDRASDPEKALEPAVIGPSVYAGEEPSEHAAPGVWAKFNAYNLKLERKLGIESVSECRVMIRRLLSFYSEVSSEYPRVRGPTSTWSVIP